MKLHCIKLLAFIGLFTLFLTSCAGETFAAVGNVSGYVKTQKTQAPVGDIWVKWISPIDLNNPGDRYVSQDGWPHEGNIAIRYAKTDSSGKFLFPPQWAPLYFTDRPIQERISESFANYNKRAEDFLTWIKPDEPAVPPDTTAIGVYKNLIAQYKWEPWSTVYDIRDRGQTGAFQNAISEAQKYRPSGEGWVRLNNRTHLNGGFQCDAPPTLEAIKPANFKGFFDNNAKKLGDWGNGYTPIVYPGTIELVSTGPIGFHDGEGINKDIPNQGNLNSCSVFGWTKKLDSDQQLDVQIFIGGPFNSGVPSIKTKANIQRGDLGSHGFDIRLPEQYRDGVKKDIYVYAIDTDGSLTPLSQTPRNLVCETSTSPPTPTPRTTTPTPNPTPKPVLSPKVDIWAESGSQLTGRGTPGGTLKINVDQPTTIAWTAQNASSCVGSGNWAGVKKAGAVRLSQLLSKVEPGLTYNYTLTCFNNETGEQESDTVIISVNPGSERPRIQTEEGDVHSNEGINLPQ